MGKVAGPAQHCFQSGSTAKGRKKYREAEEAKPIQKKKIMFFLPVGKPHSYEN